MHFKAPAHPHIQHTCIRTHTLLHRVTYSHNAHVHCDTLSKPVSNTTTHTRTRAREGWEQCTIYSRTNTPHGTHAHKYTGTDAHLQCSHSTTLMGGHTLSHKHSHTPHLPPAHPPKRNTQTCTHRDMCAGTEQSCAFNVTKTTIEDRIRQLECIILMKIQRNFLTMSNITLT